MRSQIRDYCSADGVDFAGLGEYLDRLDEAARAREVLSLTARDQAAIFEAAAGQALIQLSDLVPPETPPLQQVVHLGRNSLPRLHRFQKRFCRPASGSDHVVGYNEHVLRPLIGPGYFVSRPGNPHELLIDYAEVPGAKAPNWPRIRPNSTLRGRAVYHGMLDVVRKVSREVSVGRALRNGSPVDNWFVLCRLVVSSGENLP